MTPLILIFIISSLIAIIGSLIEHLFIKSDYHDSFQFNAYKDKKA